MADAGSGKMFTPMFLALPSTFVKEFFDPSTPSMRKVDNGGKKREKKEEKKKK